MSEKPSASLTGANRNSRVILLVAIVLAVVVLIIRNIDVTKNILLVMLGFGAVVLVHEFGHFVVAKLCGINVEAFSIFMPPILLGIKKADRGWRVRILPELFRQEGQGDEEGQFSFTLGKKILPGETEYRIGLIPFGGFVKMLGQDDVGPVKASGDPRSFANKPALARAAVLAAGVTFNVISAVIVYIVVFLVGINLMGPVVGGVIPGSTAERAGIRAGDEVIEVAGQGGQLDFSDVMMAAALSGKGQTIPVKVRHEDGTIGDYNLAAEMMPGGQFRGFGIERPVSLRIAKLSDKDIERLFSSTGLLPGDRIKAASGIDVNSYWQMEGIVERTFAPNITVLAEREEPSGRMKLAEGRLSLGFAPTLRLIGESDLPGMSEADLANIFGMVPRLKVTVVSEESLSLKQRISQLFGGAENVPQLEPNDIITAVGDIENLTYLELRKQTMANEGRKLPITVLRRGRDGVLQRVTVAVVPQKEPDTGRVMIGIAVEPDVDEAVVARTIATEGQPQPAAIPPGAAITAVDGVAVKNFYDIARQLERNAGQRVTIDWRLNEQNAGNAAIDIGKNIGMPAMHAYIAEPVPFADLERLYKAAGPIDAIKMGYKRTKTFIIQTYITLQRLIGGLVSPKQLMGPVGILTFSYRIVAAKPLIYYVYFLGLISASIAVINFLPVPPFDGGLTLLLLVEKIKGTALSLRTQEIIAYVGWGLVGALLLYVTFNDIVRSFLG
jgi:regulator of sigma E protease